MKQNLINFINKIKKNLLISCDSEHEAEQQAWWILEEITKKNKTKLLLKDEIELNDEQIETINNWINQRVKEHKPLQYIFGYLNFLNLKILVEPPILIPRPETEDWINFLIKKLEKIKTEKLSILDIGTGSGCIALALGKNFPNFNITGIDINEKAIILATKNKELNNIKNVNFIISNFYENLENKKFDIIVSNPPYICENEWENLDKTVKDWEDKKALVANQDCLHAYKIIINNAKNHLLQTEILIKNNINNLFIEIGKDQENDIKILLETNGFINICFRKDLVGVIRLIHALLDTNTQK